MDRYLCVKLDFFGKSVAFREIFNSKPSKWNLNWILLVVVAPCIIPLCKKLVVLLLWKLTKKSFKCNHSAYALCKRCLMHRIIHSVALWISMNEISNALRIDSPQMVVAIYSCTIVHCSMYTMCQHSKFYCMRLAKCVSECKSLYE